MELKEAIEKLNNFKSEKLERDKLEINPRGGFKIGAIFKYTELDKAIDTVLNELDNRNKRIYKLEKNIEFIINKIVNKAKTYQYHTKITAGTNIETNIGQQILTELLEEIKKEI